MRRGFVNEFLRRSARSLRNLVKAMLWTSLINLIILIIGFYFADISYYGLKAFGIALIDLIPLIGGGLVMIPWAIILLFQKKFSLSLIIMALFLMTFIVRQIVQPLLLGKSLGPKPAFTLTITSACVLILGPTLGAIVASVLSVITGIIIEMRDDAYFTAGIRNSYIRNLVERIPFLRRKRHRKY